MISVLGNGGLPDYGDSGCKMYATDRLRENPLQNARTRER